MDGSLVPAESIPAETISLAKQFKAIPEFKAIKPKQRKYLLAYCATGSITGCGKHCGISWVNHYYWIKNSDAYKEAYEKARQMFGDYAEGDVFNRAFIGERHEVTKIRGDSVTTDVYNRKSDVLAIFALKGLRPEYRDGFNITTIGPAALAISYPGQAQNRATMPDNGLIKQGEEPEEATIINPPK